MPIPHTDHTLVGNDLALDSSTEADDRATMTPGGDALVIYRIDGGDEVIAADRAGAPSVVQLKPNPVPALSGATTEAEHVPGVKLKTRYAMRQATEHERIRQAIDDTLADHAATDDVNDPRAWA